MVIIFLGPPGVGKGTQSRKITEAYGLPHISTGDIIRDAIRSGSPLGKRFREYVVDGQLVPDQLVVDIVAARVEHSDCVSGYLLDGFPRTVPQAEALDDLLKRSGRSVSAVIEIAVDEEELKQRLIARGQAEGRSDDTPETIAARLRIYAEETAPLVDFYSHRKLHHRIDGVGSMDEVYARISAILDPLKAKT